MTDAGSKQCIREIQVRTDAEENIGPKKEKVTGKYGKLHKQKLNSLHVKVKLSLCFN
jgi:hypothetical protein